MIGEDTRQLLEHYPKIFFACHRRHVRDVATQRVLSAHQASILDHLDPISPTNLTGLARHMGVTPSTMSLSVERLVRAGYVTRDRDPGDRRRVHLKLTAHGERLKEAQSVLEPDCVRALLERLSPPEREAGLSGLAVLARAASELMHERSARRGARGEEEP